MTAPAFSGAQLLNQCLRDASVLRSLSPEAWDLLLEAADHRRLAGRVAHDGQLTGAVAGAPAWARDRMVSALVQGQEFERMVRWEMDRILRALSPAGIDPVFLKGAAYVALGLPFAAGRQVADVDILVAESDLARTEAALLKAGWAFAEQTAYDERYYREWIHELPPLRHRDRRTMVDVHHAILPRTGRLHPPTSRLLDVTMRADPVRVLCPSHMALHAAAHAFQDGELAGAIRDLVDLDGLFRHFGRSGDFWPAIVREADALGLGRPLYYAVRYARRTCETPVPGEAANAIERWAPGPLVRGLMDRLVESALWKPPGRRAQSPAVFALYARSHWLKMPPVMLVRHLLHQAVAR